MFKISIILLLVFCIDGALFGTQVTNKDESSTKVASSNNGAMSGLSKLIFQMLVDYLTSTMLQVMEMIKELAESAKMFAGDVLGYLARSEDTRVARTRRSITPSVHKDTQNSDKNRMGSMIFSIFMMPFKAISGVVERLPYKAVIGGTSKIAIPVAKMIGNNTLVKAAVNKTMELVEVAGDKLWDFGVTYVFPRGDKLITALHESQTMPEPVMTYLLDIQKIYHIFKFLGIA